MLLWVQHSPQTSVVVPMRACSTHLKQCGWRDEGIRAGDPTGRSDHLKFSTVRPLGRAPGITRRAANGDRASARSSFNTAKKACCGTSLICRSSLRPPKRCEGGSDGGTVPIYYPLAAEALAKEASASPAVPLHGVSLRSTCSQSNFSTAKKACCGTSTVPICFIFFFPSFCFSSSLRFRLMSPP